MVQVEVYGANVILSIKNRKKIDILIKDTLKKTIQEYINRIDIGNIVLDLKGVEFIDSSSFFMLLRVISLIRRSNKHFFISNVSKELNELIHYVKMENVLKTINMESIIPKSAA